MGTQVLSSAPLSLMFVSILKVASGSRMVSESPVVQTIWKSSSSRSPKGRTSLGLLVLPEVPEGKSSGVPGGAMSGRKVSVQLLSSFSCPRLMLLDESKGFGLF